MERSCCPFFLSCMDVFQYRHKLKWMKAKRESLLISLLVFFFSFPKSPKCVEHTVASSLIFCFYFFVNPIIVHPQNKLQFQYKQLLQRYTKDANGFSSSILPQLALYSILTIRLIIIIWHLAVCVFLLHEHDTFAMCLLIAHIYKYKLICLELLAVQFILKQNQKKKRKKNGNNAQKTFTNLQTKSLDEYLCRCCCMHLNFRAVSSFSLSMGLWSQTLFPIILKIVIFKHIT